MSKPRAIELLAPAKNLECARQVILHGADAVYIGAPKFGARAAAGNSLDDIAALVAFAHQYYVRVYVTVNTLLLDEELPEAEALIWQLWRMGVDALIVQDMGITRLNLPPIPLHASTQTDNRTPEKVGFLARAGFRQVVLARELSLEQIREISCQSDARLEVFVHGALCVSYSGQCYMSQVLGGRSANRGVCAQFCRLPYDLVDADGRVLMSQKHLLSLRDLSRPAEDLEALIDAGVSSFKIEGRLKEVAYGKNVTAWYRRQLDSILARRPDLCRSSSGQESIGFEPKVSKSFNRGFTDYFLHGRQGQVWNFDTPKSMGEEVGFMRAQKTDHFIYLGKEALHNGDGLSYFDEQGRFDGFRVNRVEGNRVYPLNPRQRLKTGIRLYRTLDARFDSLLQKPTAVREIPVSLQAWALPDGFALQMEDREGHRAAVRFDAEKQLALKPQRRQLEDLLLRKAHPVFRVTDCQIAWQEEFFVPNSVWTAQRNRLYTLFEQTRRIQFDSPCRRLPETSHPYPTDRLDYRGNVINAKAAEFYRMHGVKEIAPGLEWPQGRPRPDWAAMQGKKEDTLELMRCKHCLRYALNACPKQEGHIVLKEPLSLRYKDRLLPLAFDCRACEMTVLYRPFSGR